MSQSPKDTGDKRVIPAGNPPSDIPGILPETDPRALETGSSVRCGQEGTEGMEPQMGGHGKAKYSNTTTF